MKITCGIDIIEIERIKDAIEPINNKLDDKFKERVYTEKEITASNIRFSCQIPICRDVWRCP